MTKIENLTFAEAKEHCLPYTHRMKRANSGGWVTCWVGRDGVSGRHYKNENSTTRPHWQHSDHVAKDWVVELIQAPSWFNIFDINRQQHWLDFIQYRIETKIFTNDLVLDLVRFEARFGLRRPNIY